MRQTPKRRRMLSSAMANTRTKRPSGSGSDGCPLMSCLIWARDSHNSVSEQPSKPRSECNRRIWCKRSCSDRRRPDPASRLNGSSGPPNRRAAGRLQPLSPAAGKRLALLGSVLAFTLIFRVSLFPRTSGVSQPDHHQPRVVARPVPFIIPMEQVVSGIQHFCSDLWAVRRQFPAQR